jgi:hypothetical protein
MKIKGDLIKLNKLIPLKIQKELDEKKNDYRLKKTLLKDGVGVDLRKFDTPVKVQWNGTCTTFGLIAAMENLLKGKVHLSERDLWSRYRKYSSSVAIKTAENVKICEEKYWPQNVTRLNKSCKKNRRYGLKAGTEYLGDNVMSAIEAMDDGFPVYIAMSTPKGMYQCDKYISHNSGNTGGGHALAVVGYKIDKRLKSGGYFILKNSWGSDCGDKGYQYLDHDFCRKQGKYCLMWRIDKLEKCVEYKRLWRYFWTRKICVRWE